MIDQEFKDQWTAALRSGEYPQGRGTLAKVSSDGVNYCCLGVACRILQQSDSAITSWVSPGGYTYFKYEDQEESAGLTDGLAARLGLTYDEQEKLISMNDHAKASFNEIADWIDENL